MAKNKKGNPKISNNNSPNKNNKNPKNNNSSTTNTAQKSSSTPNNTQQTINKDNFEVGSTSCSRNENSAASVIQPFDLAQEAPDDDPVELEEEYVPVSRTNSASSVSDKVILKLDIEDVQSEIDYWTNAIFCYVLGANPPGYVLGGFLRRVWKFHDIDTVSTLANGICVVRFKDDASKQTVLRSGPVFFYNKPLVVKDWTPDVKMVKTDMEVVPIWIRFYGLDLKFWGLALNKIASLVGKPVRLDTATHTKSFLGYARIMVEVSMGQDFPDVIEFLDEMDVCHRQIVHYEWKPVKCTECSGMGHLAAVCRKKKEVVQNKGKARQEWRPKPVKPAQAPPVPPAAPIPVEIPLPTIDPTAIVTPMPVNGGILNTITPARIITKLLRQGPDKAQGRGEGRSFMDRMILSLGRSNGPATGVRRKTRVKTNNINKVKNGLNKHWQLLHNNDIKEGGRIWLMWDEQIYKVDLISKFAQVIHVRVTYMLNNFSWFLSMVYGFNKSHEREELWHVLSSLEFQDCVENRGLCDVASSGAFFTWNNKQAGEARVYSRIDRIMANDHWVMEGPEGSFSFLPEGLYDHSPCGHLEYSHPRFPYVSSGGVKLLKAPLKVLNREYFGQVETAAHLAEILLHTIQKKVHADPARRRSNKVLQIKNAHGTICDNNSSIEQAFLDYYVSLLGSDRAVSPVSKGVMAHGALVTESQAAVMIREITDAEIKDALFSIPPDKAPGPDGYTSQFFKDAFPVVGPDIIQAVKDFFRNGRLLQQLNATVLTLIPKKDKPETVMDFRPIACCNVLYKCITKILCTRLNEVLGNIISHNQTAFIKGRDIVDNVLICQDLVRLYNRKSCSPRALMKIDLRKAYDTIEWTFIKDVLVSLKFPETIVRWIMACVTSTSFSLSLNGNQFGYFHGKRGIRQGDPMSPLLFTLCMEYLSRILAVVTAKQGFNFHPLCRSLHLSHLCFADDLLLFSRGDCFSIKILLRALKTFEVASGLAVNHDKSELFMNGICPEDKVKILLFSNFTLGVFPFSKHHGGWVFLTIFDWNKASIAKFTWWIASKQDHLWIKWVNAIYIKHNPWWNYQPSLQSSWSWRQICKIKDIFKPGYSNDLWVSGDYSVQKGYEWLHSDAVRVPWWPMVWNNLNVPKHSFIFWLYALNRLSTRDRLVAHGICSETVCVLCQQEDECRTHLFFHCAFSRRCLHLVQEWLQFDMGDNEPLLWCSSWRCPFLFQKQVTFAGIASLIYHLWEARNRCRMEGILPTPGFLFGRIKQDVIGRALNKLAKCKTRVGSNWLTSVGITS
ncbi:uncharacterized protein LOC141649648 [Silene latifolia]|uniref:uncharacterized protein LOC141649648 n=1 Tax=Silene latifolia TaxID=37657 RepID=UPI003D78901B